MLSLLIGSAIAIALISVMGSMLSNTLKQMKQIETRTARQDLEAYLRAAYDCGKTTATSACTDFVPVVTQDGTEIVSRYAVDEPSTKIGPFLVRGRCVSDTLHLEYKKRGAWKALFRKTGLGCLW